MNQYTYTIITYGPAKTYASINAAIEWIAEYIMTDKARCFSPTLWILDKNSDMIGNIYFAGKDAKIMIGENNPLVIDACFMLRTAIVTHHKNVA